MIKSLSPLLLFIILVSSCNQIAPPHKTSYYLNLDNCLKAVFDQSAQFPKNKAEENKKPYVNSEAVNLIDLLKQSEQSNRSIILYFTAYGCQQCRVMEEEVLMDSPIDKRLREEFLFIPLSVDEREQLPHNSSIRLSEDCQIGTVKTIQKIGTLNSHLQTTLSRSGSQPYFYAFNTKQSLGSSGNIKTVEGFEDFLNSLE